MHPTSAFCVPLLCVALAASLQLVPAAASGWHTDIEAAKTAAAADKKDLLLDFTGSDWCPPCMKLHEDVFSQPAFAGAADRYALVEIDFPRATPLSPEATARNAALAEAYGIKSYPTILLADAQGRVYARTGYMALSPAGYLAHLDDLQRQKTERDRLLADAAQENGLAKARLLDQAISVQGSEISLFGYDAEVAAIIAADADGKAGLRSRYQSLQLMGEISRLAAAGDVTAAMERVDAAIAMPTLASEFRQQLLMMKASVAFQNGDKIMTLDLLQKARDAAPDTKDAAMIQRVLDQLTGAVPAPAP